MNKPWRSLLEILETTGRFVLLLLAICLLSWLLRFLFWDHVEIGGFVVVLAILVGFTISWIKLLGGRDNDS